MRQLVFQKGSEMVVIKVENTIVTFAKAQGQYMRFSTIDGLKLNLSGILKEFPDLVELSPEEARIEAIKRFKAKVGELNEDKAIEEYIVNDLKPHGYILLARMRPGFRPEKIKH